MNVSMMNTQLLVAFTMTVVVVVAVPGPSAMFIVGRAMAIGRPAAIAAAAGNTAGTIIQGLVAVFGLGAVISRSETLYNVIKFGGAIYLVQMGAKTIRHRELPSADGGREDADRRRVARQGFVVGLTNPKLVVFFGAALPQFVDPTRGYVVVQMLALLTIWSAVSLIGDTTWGCIGGCIRSRTANSPRNVERMIALGGVCIVGVGILLAVSQRS